MTLADLPRWIFKDHNLNLRVGRNTDLDFRNTDLDLRNTDLDFRNTDLDFRNIE